jgi:hypothetical protein
MTAATPPTASAYGPTSTPAPVSASAQVSATAPTSPTECHFIRATHDRNGCARTLSPQAWQFWQQYGHIVGSVLRPETATPFSAIVEACRELAEEQADCIPYPEEDERYVAWVLLKLVEHGLAAITTNPAVSTLPPTPAQLYPRCIRPLTRLIDQ